MRVWWWLWIQIATQTGPLNSSMVWKTGARKLPAKGPLAGVVHGMSHPFGARVLAESEVGGAAVTERAKLNCKAPDERQISRPGPWATLLRKVCIRGRAT